MSANSHRISRMRPDRACRAAAGGLILAAILCTSGCSVALDALDPNLLQQFGLDASALTPPLGTIIVSFDNRTAFPSEFLVLAGGSVAFTDNNVATFRARVQANGKGNWVRYCPVNAVYLGSLEGEGLSNIAVQVTTDEGVVDVPYTGSVLAVSRDFRCGDVINVVLSGTDAFSLSIEVLRGR